MPMSPGMKMMLVQKAAKRGTSEYAGTDGRRMIGFARDENREKMRGGEYNRARGEYNGYEGGASNRARGEYNGNEGGASNRARGEYNGYEGGEYNRVRNDYPRGEYNANPSNEYAYAPGMQMQSRAAMPIMPPMPPIYPNMRAGNDYGDIYAHGHIYAPGAMNKPMESRTYDQGMNEPVTEHKARKWVEKMSSGEHFKPEIAEQHRVAFCPNCDKWEFYVAMNAMYADYKKTGQEMGVDKPDYYARLARDFIKDEDAAPGKVARYMETIPKK